MRSPRFNLPCCQAQQSKESFATIYIFCSLFGRVEKTKCPFEINSSLTGQSVSMKEMNLLPLKLILNGIQCVCNLRVSICLAAQPSRAKSLLQHNVYMQINADKFASRQPSKRGMEYILHCHCFHLIKSCKSFQCRAPYLYTTQI